MIFFAGPIYPQDDIWLFITYVLTKVVPMCSVFQAPSYGPNPASRAPISAELAYLSKLCILGLARALSSASQLDTEYHAKINKRWQKLGSQR